MGNLKNYAKLLLGVAVLGAGAGAASFAQGQKKSDSPSKIAAMRYWGNNSTTGKYEELAGPPDFTTNCKSVSSRDCVIQSENTSLPSTLPYDQATPINGVQPHPSSTKAFY